MSIRMEPSNTSQHIADNQIGPTSQILSHEINETSNWLTLTIPIDWQPKCTHFKSILTSSLNTSLNNPYHFGVCIKDLLKGKLLYLILNYPHFDVLLTALIVVLFINVQ